MPSVYLPRRPRASPLWQIVHHAWSEFLGEYESSHRRPHGPLRPDTVHVVENFYRCGDLSQGFTRLQCPDCGHEKLLAFSCKGRHFCPSCHQRRVRQTGHWIAHTVCREVPHRQFVFTMPRPLRGIYRSSRSWRTKRNFQVFTATEFLAAAVEHIPPKNQHTVRHYGRYSNKCRGMEVQTWEGDPADHDPTTVPAPAPQSARNLRPLWRNLILRIWGEDPLICPCCKGLMKVPGSLTRPEEIRISAKVISASISPPFLPLHPLQPRALRLNETRPRKAIS